ncbi:putative molybdenum cofactor guanylyltransferase [[Clostridium] ultunense Esp]|nr:putative molybdenum cofactor guanylyltransferase [[Clostridium] ultunense Esp]
MKATACLLAGGKSQRMGRNKALLPMGEMKNMERIIQKLHPYFEEMLLIANEPEEFKEFGLPIFSDRHPGKGPLAGIHAGLISSSHEANLMVACDMPFVSGELAAFLIKLSEGYEAVVPRVGGVLHPLFAVYRRSLIGKADRALQEGKLKLTDFLSTLHVRFVDETDLPSFPDLRWILFNMNTPAEYEMAKKRLSLLNPS